MKVLIIFLLALFTFGFVGTKMVEANNREATIQTISFVTYNADVASQGITTYSKKGFRFKDMISHYDGNHYSIIVVMEKF